MRIDENEKISIWLAGNTGLRNPMRIQEGFIAFSQSPYVGNLHGNENETGFMRFLDEKGIINNETGKDPSGSHARKWRLMFERYGFIYGPVKKQSGIEQDSLGNIDEITPFGRTFINADTIPAMQECFLRSLSVEQYELPDKSGYYSPFRWILSIMLEMEKKTGSSELSRMEFALWGHTTNPSYDINEVVEHIISFRERRKKAYAKRPFDRSEISQRSKFYDKKSENFLDYCDMNMRYLRISGILQRKGRGLVIVPSKHVIAESLAKTTPSQEPLLDTFKKLTTGAPLPTDRIDVARTVLDDLMQQMKARSIEFDISGLPLDTPAEVNVARRRLEEIIAQTDEINYAAEQKNKWKEISDYMSLLIKGGGKIEYDEDNVIEVPKDETPAYLEWTLWRAALAIDHLVSKPYEVRGFGLDSDYLPVSTAGGGKGDLYCEFDRFTILTEVTMSTSSRQEAMEGEPVRRHVSDAIAKCSKPVFGLFIAVKIDVNTAETFRHGIWYTKRGERQRLTIVPISLSQFQYLFEMMFKTNQASPEKLVELIELCARKRDAMEAPAWQAHIDSIVRASIYYEKSTSMLSGTKITPNSDVIYQQSQPKALMLAEEQTPYGKGKEEHSFPYGILFGTLIKDNCMHRVGCVVGKEDKYILVVFEDVDNNNPRVELIDEEGFKRGIFQIA